jgi:hypothetical protein
VTTCAACSTAYAVGLTACPHCGSEEVVVPKAHVYVVPVEPAPVEPAGAPEIFDPGAHTVAEVEAYLDGCDEDEYDRVLVAELAGKRRVALVGKDNI